MNPGNKTTPFFLTLLIAALLGVGHAHSATQYYLDQKFGSITFSVRHLGIFSSEGRFRRFSAILRLNGLHPQNTQVSADVDATSVEGPYEQATELLKSPDFFNVQRYPVIHFQTTSIRTVGPVQYAVLGLLTIRGITRPFVLQAKLADRHGDPVLKAEVAEFVATGTLQRSAFGMTADPAFISDQVAIKIDARIALEADADAQ